MRLPKTIIYILFIFIMSCNMVSQNDNKSIKETEITRIMGLSPALTEILYFACPDSIIVARSQACNFPEDVLTKPVIQTYPLDIEGLIVLNPDLILNEEGIISRDQIQLIEEKNLKIKTFSYRNMNDIFLAIQKVSTFCDCEELVRPKLDGLKKDLKEIGKIEGRKTALGLIWTDPIYVYGLNTLFSDQLSQIGIKNAIQEDFEKQYPEISREYILKINPDIIIGGSFEQLDSTFFSKYPELKKINAYKDSSIYDIDSDLLTRPGPRSVLAVKEMFNAIHEN